MGVSKNFFFLVHNEAAAAAFGVPLVLEQSAQLPYDVPSDDKEGRTNQYKMKTEGKYTCNCVLIQSLKIHHRLAPSKTHTWDK